MKKYDLIVIGTGSGMNYADAIMDRNPDYKVAVIDKDEPGGICLTRGCIPSKLLIYPAELLRTIGTAGRFGIDVEIKSIDFAFVMERMRTLISKDIDLIRRGLSKNPGIDYYHDIAAFESPYTLKVGNDIITSKMIFLCTGSRPIIPPVKGLVESGYLTSDTVLKMEELPASIAIIGGGYIAAEYGHFFSAMGSRVTVIGRNPRFLPDEEPEISALAKREMSGYMDILTGYEVLEVIRESDGKRKIIGHDKKSGKKVSVTADEILVASGRGPNTDYLKPEKGGIKTDDNGWIDVNEYMETSQPNIWAFGDANGRHLFKHVANYESTVVYQNAILKENIKIDYRAVPHAVFSYPEIAGVGMKEKEAVEKYGEENVLIGFQLYEDIAKGEAMDVMDYFVKVIVEKDSSSILGAHIIGPYASILIHEIIPLMYTPGQSATPIIYGMHIHPALSEVVERAFQSLMEPADYRHVLDHLHLEPMS
ncbi:MAG: dihydrolipoyl dehydrogenase [Candidatus Methanoperedens sp.]|nr:dihydrolipoyl dehydrogenase [Candidatus Methanoperedens sp.]MCZ7371357.1 dihydrolipoyl dehydrogenase [Candidatus Methanoperedens sp.]